MVNDVTGGLAGVPCQKVWEFTVWNKTAKSLITNILPLWDKLIHCIN